MVFAYRPGTNGAALQVRTRGVNRGCTGLHICCIGAAAGPRHGTCVQAGDAGGGTAGEAGDKWLRYPRPQNWKGRTDYEKPTYFPEATPQGASLFFLSCSVVVGEGFLNPRLRAYFLFFFFAVW